MPACEIASGCGSAASAKASETAFSFRARGTPSGLGTPVFPSPDSAIHFVSSLEEVFAHLRVRVSLRIEMTTSVGRDDTTRICVRSATLRDYAVGNRVH